MSKQKFNLIMISAMYENGGNTIQRHLDGHPQLLTYPFESQVGTRTTCDYLQSFVPHKYRWPQIQLGDTTDEIYESIFDEEVKIRIKAPQMSKFKDVEIQLDDRERKKIFQKLLSAGEVTRARVIEAFFRATFMAWKNFKQTGNEDTFVGYNPVQVLDADKIINDFPQAKVLHIVRNPFSCYAETKHRPAPLSLERYINTWNVTQLAAVNFSNKYPKNVIVVRFEDLIENPKKFFQTLCPKLGIKFSEALLYPSWNGNTQENMYSWGTIQYPTVEYNLGKIKELSKAEYAEVKSLTAHFNEYFNYSNL